VGCDLAENISIILPWLAGNAMELNPGAKIDPDERYGAL
jgi:hypothetical protein